MSSSGLRGVAMHFYRRDDVSLRVEDEDIAEIVAESTSVYVDLVLVDDGSVAPTGKEGTIFHLALLPSKVEY